MRFSVSVKGDQVATSSNTPGNPSYGDLTAYRRVLEKELKRVSDLEIKLIHRDIKAAGKFMCKAVVYIGLGLVACFLIKAVAKYGEERMAQSQA